MAAEKMSNAPLVIQLQGNKVVIPAGKAHRVNVGSEIMLLLGTQSTLFSVDEVNKIWCSAIVPKRLSLLLKQYRHTITLSRWHLGEKKLQEDVAKIRGPAWLIASNDPVRPVNLGKDNFSELAAEAALTFAHLARFSQILLLRAQSSPKPALFSVSIKPVNSGTAADVYPIHQKFRYTFENESDEELHITVVIFSPEFSIEQLYPPRDNSQT
ncbi:hypothetical protein M441DRAFT_49905 [Trichoderma asperellum CBS 433.97]|uniref:Uncharacterized protein n=1 Tax=Trichoderma asperellum (strain ATCC 204424 / CBS 433.97 / NBRC 101777) TaxID=1042311 RepID=A0A2T3Z0Y7_TRIA4|nr:hypothetical protein M441DRAFT_49905 [Trichoderma asperellum CBS 433.97]PTB38463.1 hypothetical protein M441DRAFT_49905 [Trichoderma asperellum CBS 433.97]